MGRKMLKGVELDRKSSSDVLQVARYPLWHHSGNFRAGNSPERKPLPVYHSWLGPLSHWGQTPTKSEKWDWSVWIDSHFKTIGHRKGRKTRAVSRIDFWHSRAMLLFRHESVVIMVNTIMTITKSLYGRRELEISDYKWNFVTFLFVFDQDT